MTVCLPLHWYPATGKKAGSAALKKLCRLLCCLAGLLRFAARYALFGAVNTAVYKTTDSLVEPVFVVRFLAASWFLWCAASACCLSAFIGEWWW